MSVAPWPKRRETTFTSSGWETKSAMRNVYCGVVDGRPKVPPTVRINHQKLLLFSTLPIFLEYPIDLVGGEVFVKIVIHLGRRRPTACTNAFHLFQRKQTVRGDPFVSDAEAPRAMFQNLFATAHHATNVGADLHVEFPAGLSGQHRVIADYISNFEFG